jgi:hypothetical protein
LAAARSLNSELALSTHTFTTIEGLSDILTDSADEAEPVGVR